MELWSADDALEDRQADSRSGNQVSVSHKAPDASRTIQGRRFVVSNWNHRVLQPADSEGVSRSDPEEIIRQFGKQKYTQALALVVSWGTMWRQPNAVWGNRELGKIDSLLRECSESIRQSESIEESWRELVNHLGWSSVLISKTLHFLCLSLGFKHDPPVPIDGDVIRGKVWPVFIHPVPLKRKAQELDR